MERRKSSKTIKFLFGILFGLTFTLLWTPGNAHAAKVLPDKEKIFVGEMELMRMEGVSGSISWSSSNKKVATVNSDGILNVKKPGNVIIKAKCGSKTYSRKYKVKYATIDFNRLKYRNQICPGGIQYKFSPKYYTYSTSDKKIATFSSSGVLKFKSVGVVKLTAKLKYKKAVKDFGKYRANHSVKVKRVSIAVGKFYFEPNTWLYKEGDTFILEEGDTMNMEARLKGKGIWYSEAEESLYVTEWCSTNSEIAQVTGSGYVYGNSAGKARIYAKVEGVMKYQDVIVKSHEQIEAEAQEADKNSHQYIIEEYKPSTCTENGYKIYHCGECDKVIKVEMPLAAHTESDWIVDEEPECAKEGSRHKECSVCHKVLETEVMPSAHSSYEWKVTKEPSSLPATCAADFGQRSYVCSRCGYVKCEEIIITTDSGIVYGYYDHEKENALISDMNEQRALSRQNTTTGYTVPDVTVLDSLYQVAQINAAENAACEYYGKSTNGYPDVPGIDKVRAYIEYSNSLDVKYNFEADQRIDAWGGSGTQYYPYAGVAAFYCDKTGTGTDGEYIKAYAGAYNEQEVNG